MTEPDSHTLLTALSALSKSKDPQTHVGSVLAALESSPNPGDLHYCVQRLIKGSASLNEDVRVSFSICLGAVFEKFKDSLVLPDIMSLHDDLLTAHKLFGTITPSRSEETAILAGQLGFYGAVIKTFSTENPSIDDVYHKMIDNLLKCIGGRSFLRIPAYSLLSQLAKCPELLDVILEKFATVPADIDMLWFLSLVNVPQDKVPTHVLKEFPGIPLLSNQERIVTGLLETVSYMTEPHPLWSVLMMHTNEVGKLNQFASSIIDEILIASNSVAKRILGIKLLIDLLSKNFSVNASMPNLLQLLNALGPKHVKKSKGDLPLNTVISTLMSKMIQFKDQIGFDLKVGLTDLQNFRLFPREFVDAILSDPVLYDRYVTKLQENALKSEQADFHQVFDCLIDVVILRTNEDLFKKVLSLGLKKLGDGETDYISQRIQTLLRHQSKTSGIESTLNVSLEVVRTLNPREEIEDEIVLEALETLEGTEKTINKVLKKKEGFLSLFESARICCSLFEIWLHINPVLVVDSTQDLNEIVKRASKRKVGENEPSPLEVFIDLLLNLLSSPSVFLKEVSDHCFTKIASHVDRPALEVIFNVLDSNQKVEDENILEEEDDDDDESDSDDDEEIENGAFTTPTIPEKRSFDPVDDESDEDCDDPEVFLDDADEDELAMFDAKLAEIFKLKKQEKKSFKLSEKMAIEFKCRILDWLRILVSQSNSLNTEVSIYLRVQMLKSLVKNFQADSKNSDRLCRSLADLIVTASKKIQDGKFDGSESYIDEIFDEILENTFDCKLLWNSSAAVIRYLLRFMNDKAADQALMKNLRRCWDALIEQKKMQKSTFPDFFNLWMSWSPAVFADFVKSCGFFEGLEQFNSHCRIVMINTFKTLIKQSNADYLDSPLLLGLVAFVSKVISDEGSGKALQKDSMSTLLLCTKKSPLFFDLDLKMKINALESSCPKNLSQILREAITILQKST